MMKIIGGLVLLIEIFALSNRGGGPLLSHLFLTGITFGIVCLFLIFQKSLSIPPRYPILSYGLFFLCFSISLILSLTPEFGLSEFLLFANAGLLLILLSAIRFSERDLHLFSIGLIAIALIDTMIGYFIYTGHPFPRFAGTFIDLSEPYTAFGNDFANFLLLTIPLSLWQFFKKHKRFSTILVTGLTTAILLSGFILSFSRGALLSAFAVCILALVWWIIRWRREKAVVGVGVYAKARSDVPVHQNLSKKSIATRTVLLIFTTFFLVSALQLARSQRFPTISLLQKATFEADEGSASVGERIEFWKGALKIIKDQPLFGNGVLSFKYLFPRYQASFGTNWDHPHNIFLKIGVENGIFAGVLFGIFLIGAAIISIRFLWKHPWHPVFFFLLGALAAFGHNLVDFNFIVSNFTLFIVYIGVALSFASSKRQISEKRSITLYLYRGIAAVSFFLLLLAIHEGFYNIDFKKGRQALREENFENAIMRLERARKLFFERDLSHYLTQAYNAQYQKTKNTRWRQKEKQLLMSKFSHTKDAALIARLGELYLEDRDYKTAEELFLKSISLDPSNRLKYYYELLDLEVKIGRETNSAFRKKLEALLDQYIVVLKNNKHNTILTDNPSYAFKIAEFIGMQSKAEKIKQLRLQEYVKIIQQYGPQTLVSWFP